MGMGMSAGHCGQALLVLLLVSCQAFQDLVVVLLCVRLIVHPLRMCLKFTGAEQRG